MPPPPFAPRSFSVITTLWLGGETAIALTAQELVYSVTTLMAVDGDGRSVSVSIQQSLSVDVSAPLAVTPAVLIQALRRSYCGARTCEIIAADVPLAAQRMRRLVQPDSLSFNVTRELAVNDSLAAPLVSSADLLSAIGHSNTSGFNVVTTLLGNAANIVSEQEDSKGAASALLDAATSLPTTLSEMLGIPAGGITQIAQPQVITPPAPPPSAIVVSPPLPPYDPAANDTDGTPLRAETLSAASNDVAIFYLLVLVGCALTICIVIAARMIHPFALPWSTYVLPLVGAADAFAHVGFALSAWNHLGNYTDFRALNTAIEDLTGELRTVAILATLLVVLLVVLSISVLIVMFSIRPRLVDYHGLGASPAFQGMLLILATFNSELLSLLPWEHKASDASFRKACAFVPACVDTLSLLLQVSYVAMISANSELSAGRDAYLAVAISSLVIATVSLCLRAIFRHLIVHGTSLWAQDAKPVDVKLTLPTTEAVRTSYETSDNSVDLLNPDYRLPLSGTSSGRCAALQRAREHKASQSGRPVKRQNSWGRVSCRRPAPRSIADRPLPMVADALGLTSGAPSPAPARAIPSAETDSVAEATTRSTSIPSSSNEQHLQSQGTQPADTLASIARYERCAVAFSAAPAPAPASALGASDLDPLASFCTEAKSASTSVCAAAPASASVCAAAPASASVRTAAPASPSHVQSSVTPSEKVRRIQSLLVAGNSPNSTASAGGNRGGGISLPRRDLSAAPSLNTSSSDDPTLMSI